MQNKSMTLLKILAAGLFGLAAILLSICIGSVYINIDDTLGILGNKLFNMRLVDSIDKNMVSILWEVRIPRALTAFFVGGALAVSGLIMQSILQNPLASSYTLGVSSGASLGAAILIVMGVGGTIWGFFLLPFVGFMCGFLTVLIVILIASRIDEGLHNHTIILFGMVFSLFINALLTMISALNQSHMQRLILWQMGTFSGKRWSHVAVISIVTMIVLIITSFFHKELDIISFGDEGAMSIGVNTRKTKIILIVLAAVFTGVSVCFAGVIGFVDLMVPHIVRRIYGYNHRITIPMSMLVGGAFMSLCDLIARVVLAPQDIPVGAITALLGGPFFLLVYFGGRK
ncbi:MAG: iron ABC transporter permease [Butyrivibrio sp.]|nr:iron ABC transporter permease [Butyrivibrio sp.]